MVSKRPGGGIRSVTGSLTLRPPSLIIPAMGVAVLGPVEVGGDGVGIGPRERVVLAALIVDRGDVVSAESLADALWEEPPESWRKVVQGCVVRLRKVLGAEAIETRGGGYRLALPAEQVDSHRFERSLVRARELLALGDPDRAAFVANEALELWRGRALPELDSWDHGRIEAARLEELRLEAQELRIDASLQAGRYHDVLAEAQARVAAEPLRERRWALLAMALYQAGRQGDALRTLHQARQMLLSELGLDPGPDIVALEEAILRQDPSLIAARLPDPSPVCPYRGLRAYGSSDHDSYFGRETEIAECLELLTSSGVLAVLGPSGSGKSSLIRAGICAALERTGEQVAILTPGPHPMDVVADLSKKSDLVLVVDQCEEAVMLCEDPLERRDFFDFLVAHSNEGRLVVISLRADRLGDLSTYPGFAALVERGLYLLKPLTESSLRAVIEGPARQAGLLLEPGLVDVLIRDVEGEPGYLPLLSHALREIWKRREGSTLTVAGYRASGGIQGAVAQTAEKVYEESSPEQRPLLRDLLLRLVAPSPDGEPVRARVPRRIVASDAEHEALVERLVEARLLTGDEVTVELAHEALARAWPRLRNWLDDDLEGQRIWRHLAVAAQSWEAMGRPDSELYRGTRLAQALEWRSGGAPDLNALETEFLDEGERLDTLEQLALEERVRLQTRTNHRLRLLVGGVAVLALVAAVAGLVARGEAARADAAAAAARTNELAASAIAVMGDDPSLAKILALSAVTGSEFPTVESMSALHEAIRSDLVTFRYGATFDVGLVWADLHPSGDKFVLGGTGPITGSDEVFEAGAGQVFEVVDVQSGRQLWSLDLGRDPRDASAFVGSPRFTDDGRYLVAGSFWDPNNPFRIPSSLSEEDQPDQSVLGANIWEADSGLLVDRYDLGRCGGLVVGLSDDYLLAKALTGGPDVMEACRWVDGRTDVELIDRSTRARRVLSSGTDSLLLGAAMSGDGRFVAYDDDDELVVLDLANGLEHLRISGRGVRDLSYDGSLILVGEEPMEVLDVSTGKILASFAGHNGKSLFARFDDSGESVFSTGDDGWLRQWDARTGAELFSYPGVGNGRPSFTEAGLLLVARPDRDTVLLLDRAPRGELGFIDTCSGSVVRDGLSVLGETAWLGMTCDGAGETTYEVDVRGEVASSTVRAESVVSPSPDGRRFIAFGDDGRVIVKSFTGDPDAVLLEGALSGARPARLRWSRDGTMIAGIVDGSVVVWEAASGNRLHQANAETDGTEAVDVLFTPDSARLLVSTSGWLLRALSTETWETLDEREENVDGGYQMGLAGFTPDGTSLLAIGGAFGANAAGALNWIDVLSLDVQRSRNNIHEGSITSMGSSADGSLIATGASDGRVRVWDAVTGDLVHEIPVGDTSILEVAFLADHRIAIVPSTGGMLIATFDLDELIATARSSLTPRGFTIQECARFGFGTDCPTIAELGDLDPGDRGILNGTYDVGWSPDELIQIFEAQAVEYSGSQVELDESTRGFAADIAGAYTFTFSDGRFDIAKDGFEDTWCTGSYAVEGDRIWLRSERGWCKELGMFDGGFEVDKRELRIDSTDFHGVFFHRVLFATKPLERSG